MSLRHYQDLYQHEATIPRKALLARLDAGLTARTLASLAGWHFTKVSKLAFLGSRYVPTGDSGCDGAGDQDAYMLTSAGLRPLS